LEVSVIFKCKLKTYNRITDVRRSDNTLSQNIEETACIFNDFFASVFTVDNGSTAQFTDRVEVQNLVYHLLTFFLLLLKKN